MNDVWENPPFFADCVFPTRCECRLHCWALDDKRECVVPAINKLAKELGWRAPYPVPERQDAGE